MEGLAMVKRVMVWMIGVVVLLVSQVASGQYWSWQGSVGPTDRHVQHLSELLGLDAARHELLIELHTEMLRAEEESRQRFGKLYSEEFDNDQPDYDKIYQYMVECRAEIRRAAEMFYRDAKLIADKDGVGIVEHIERRLQSERLIKQGDYEVSGLAASPFELLFSERIVDSVRFGELLREHLEHDRMVGELLEQTDAALTKIDVLYKEFHYDIASATPAQLRDLGRALMDVVDRAKGLRKANEDLAAALIESLGDEDGERFERAWLLVNYGAVQQERAAERAVRAILADAELDAPTRAAVEEFKISYGERLRIARRMARVAKHRADLDYSMENLLNESEPDRSVHDAALERIERIAHAYQAALRGVLTPEQRVKYGLETGD